MVGELKVGPFGDESHYGTFVGEFQVGPLDDEHCGAFVGEFQIGPFDDEPHCGSFGGVLNCGVFYCVSHWEAFGGVPIVEHLMMNSIVEHSVVYPSFSI